MTLQIPNGIGAFRFEHTEGKYKFILVSDGGSKVHCTKEPAPNGRALKPSDGGEKVPLSSIPRTTCHAFNQQANAQEKNLRAARLRA
jgi:hypothetical protein